MKKIYLLLFVAFSATITNAQISRIATSPSSIVYQIPGYSEVSTIATKTFSYTPSSPESTPNPVDGDTTTEDSKLYRYADILPVNIVMSDGNVSSTSVGKVWTLQISISNALNVGFVFSQFNLSTSAEMYIFDEGRTVLDGPIKRPNFASPTQVGVFPIKGNSVIIYIIEPTNFGQLQSSVSIHNIEAGFQNIDDVGDVSGQTQRTTSINCIPFIQCFPSYMKNARAVARFVSNGGQGTGTLLNNELNSGHAYFLTAFHNLDKNKNGIIDPSEEAALADSRFQFQFWRSACNGPTNNSGIVFNSSILRTQNQSSDMVLLELLNPPGIGDRVSYAGWSRQTSAPNDDASYIIHHPNGEDMRFTRTRFVRNYLFNANFWQAGYSSGVVVPGSSGSALFNENDQVIGQLKGGWSSCNFTDFSDRYGKFYKSWNDANLGQWLSPSQDLQSVYTLDLGNIDIQGGDGASCNSPREYHVVSGIEDLNYQWSVSGNLQIVSGGGNSPSINVMANSGAEFSGTITCVLSTPNRGISRTITLEKMVYAPPAVSGFYSSGNSITAFPLQIMDDGTNEVQPGAVYTTITSPVTSATWSVVYGHPNYWYWIPSNKQLFINMPNEEYVIFRMSAQTGCGPAELDFAFYATLGAAYRMSPNPATNNLTIAVVQKLNSFKLGQIKKPIATEEQEIREIAIIDKTGFVLQRLGYGKETHQVNVNVSNLKPDIYMIRISNGKSFTTMRFVKQ